MYAYNTGNHGQGHTSNPTSHGSGTAPVYAPAPGYGLGLAPAPAPAPVPAAPSPPFTSLAPRTPSPSVLAPVPVPAGCYPIELVQFWRDEYKRGQPFPLHWALFVRTAPRTRPRVPGTHRSSTATACTAPSGHFYELAGTMETYTAQSLHEVTFEPDLLPDWRGTHVVGWVSPGQVGTFERAVRQVPVWRRRPDWRSQHWVYEVVRAVGANYAGVYMADGVAFGGLQQHMGKLLDAWENGDI